MNKFAVSLAVVCLLMGPVQAGLVGSLYTPEGAGLISGGETWSAVNSDPDYEGFSMLWEVSQNNDGSWHYKYTFKNETAGDLSMDVSHFIISISEGCNVYNLSSSVSEFETNTFGPGPGNPGFPVGQTISGAKLELYAGTNVAEFDSDRMPMWGDFYAKDGGSPEENFVYNADLGAVVANLHDYTASSALDANGSALFKVLVPNEIPEPATLALLGLGACLLRRRRQA